MANALVVYSNTKFKREILVYSEYCPNLIKKSDVRPEEVAFTLHIPFKQLNSWHNIKQTTLSDCSYVRTNTERIYRQTVFFKGSGELFKTR